jgi:ribonuclease P protein component
MLLSKKRLNLDLFKVVFVGKTTRGEFFNLKSLTNGHGRFSVVVPKKLLKNATKRNRVRRRVYSVIEEVATEGLGIFIVKKDITTTEWSVIKNEIVFLLKKAGLLLE